MKIKAADIKKSQNFEIIGHEDWLQPTYKIFATNQSCQPRITGNLCLTLEAAETIVQVTGIVKFSPQLPCSRCEMLVPWPIEKTFKLTFLRSAETPITGNSKKDLDTFHLSNDLVECDQIIHEQILLEIPSHIALRSPEDGTCLVCQKDISKPLFFSTSKESPSPFAQLRKLRMSD